MGRATTWEKGNSCANVLVPRDAQPAQTLSCIALPKTHVQVGAAARGQIALLWGDRVCRICRKTRQLLKSLRARFRTCGITGFEYEWLSALLKEVATARYSKEPRLHTFFQIISPGELLGIVTYIGRLSRCSDSEAITHALSAIPKTARDGMSYAKGYPIGIWAGISKSTCW